jgi:hypothetical protein
VTLPNASYLPGLTLARARDEFPGANSFSDSFPSFLPRSTRN